MLSNNILRMKKNLLFIFCAIVLLAGCVQRPQLPTFQNTGNPLVKDKFTADPAPLVYDGTLYLYVGHDEFYEGQDTAHGRQRIQHYRMVMLLYTGHANMD